MEPIKEVTKGWGKEIWIVNKPLYCGKKLILNKGKKCSVHFHAKKDETFYIHAGKVSMKLIHANGKKEQLILKPGDVLHIPPGLIHQFYGLEDSEILEFSTQHFDEDTYRLEKGD